ncbi:unnamed protein product [Staurois parvus]|uniref:Paired domain-containing protein n=1 Tax=Staurois parvus TaxID=386267 RepID=A0ABN9GKN8_9NEOB|nr:unnamed protein product [Staurois parvus]
MGLVIGCHLCNKSIRDISWLLNIAHSTVSGIITKWKQLGTTATQPPSGRSRNMTERGQCMLNAVQKPNGVCGVNSFRLCGLQISHNNSA